MIAIRHPSTSDAVAEFFAVTGNGPNLVAWIEPYIARLQREKRWTARDLEEIRRAILKWMDDSND